MHDGTPNKKPDPNKIVAIGLLLITLIAILISFVVTPAEASMGWFDTYRYDEAIVNLMDGTVVRGRLEKWWEYDGSDMLQVKIDGAIYLSLQQYRSDQKSVR